MQIVDLHSDLFTDIAWRKSRGEKSVFDRLHYPRLKAGLIDTIICVFWVEPTFRNRPLARIREIYNWVIDDLKNSNFAHICHTLNDINGSKHTGKINIVMGLEGLSFLPPYKEQIPENFKQLNEKNIHHMILAWNEANDFASGTGSVISSEKTGLTQLGRIAVSEANRLRWLVDVSHLDEQSFWDLYHHSDASIIASHSNVRTICDSDRNLTDSQLKAIASRGGIIGLNAYWGFIDPDNRTVDRFIDHAIYMADLIGVESVAFGFDFMDYLAPHDIGMNMAGTTEGLEDVTKIPFLLEKMSKRGFADKELEAIGFHNATRILLRK